MQWQTATAAPAAPPRKHRRPWKCQKSGRIQWQGSLFSVLLGRVQGFCTPQRDGHSPSQCRWWLAAPGGAGCTGRGVTQWAFKQLYMSPPRQLALHQPQGCVVGCVVICGIRRARPRGWPPVTGRHHDTSPPPLLAPCFRFSPVPFSLLHCSLAQANKPCRRRESRRGVICWCGHPAALCSSFRPLTNLVLGGGGGPLRLF